MRPNRIEATLVDNVDKSFPSHMEDRGFCTSPFWCTSDQCHICDRIFDGICNCLHRQSSFSFFLLVVIIAITSVFVPNAYIGAYISSKSFTKSPNSHPLFLSVLQVDCCTRRLLLLRFLRSTVRDLFTCCSQRRCARCFGKLEIASRLVICSHYTQVCSCWMGLRHFFNGPVDVFVILCLSSGSLDQWKAIE